MLTDKVNDMGLLQHERQHRHDEGRQQQRHQEHAVLPVWKGLTSRGFPSESGL